MCKKLIIVMGIAASLSACQHSSNDAAVIEVAKAGYDAFSVGDMEAWAATQAEDVRWRMPKGFPYGGDYVGPQAVMDGVSVRLENYGQISRLKHCAFTPQVTLSSSKQE